jgi:hypothetical protein
VENGADSVGESIEDHHVNDEGVRDRLHATARRPASSESEFFSKSPARSNQGLLDNGPGTPMTLANVNEGVRGTPTRRCDVWLGWAPRQRRRGTHPRLSRTGYSRTFCTHEPSVKP